MTPSPRTILPFAILAALIGLLAADAGHAFDCDWNGATTDWATATNWDNCNSGIPGSGDTATIPNTAANDPTIGAATTVTVTGLTIESSRTVTVAVNGTLYLGNLFGAGDLTVDGTVTWSNGTWSGTGATTINETLALTSSSLKSLNGRTLTVANSGVATWTNGEIRPTGDPLIHNDGTFDIQTDSDLNAIDGTFGTFQNDGTLQKTAGSAGTHIEMDFDNTSTGSVVVAASVGTLILGDVSASPSTSGTGSGSFSVDTGSTLTFEAAHTLQSGFSITGAGQVNFNSGTQTLANAGSTYDITGTTRRQGFSGKTTFNLTPDSVGILEAADGTLEFADTTAFAATSLEITGGAVLDLDPDLTVNGTFLHDNGTLRGDGNVVVTGATTWESGTWRNDAGSPSITVNGGLTIQTSSLKTLNGRDLIIPSGKTATWTDGEIRPDNDPLIDNQGTFDIQTEQNINDINDNFGTFKNAGTLQKTSGTANATVIEMDFDNTGSVVVNAGVLVLGDEAGQDTSGTSPGSFSVASGATLTFEAAHTLQSGFSIIGAGQVTFSRGTQTLANANSTYNVTGTTRRTGFSGKTTFNLTPDSVGVLEVNDSTLEFADTTAFAATSLEITGGAVLDLDPDLTVNGTFLHDNGTLRGDGNVVVTGATTWESGTWRNDVGSPSITVNGGLTIQTTSLKTLNGRDLVIPSGKTATWTNGEIRPTGDPLIHNDGTFDIQTDSDLNAIDGTFGTFQNDGTLQKTAGSAGTHIEMDFDNTSTGSVVVAASVGTLILGDVSASPDTSGTGSGSFSVDTGSSLAFEADHALQSGFQISGAGQVNFNSGTQTLANAGSTYDITGTTRRQGFSGKTTFNLTPDSVGVLEVNDSTLEFADTTAFAATSLEITGGAVLDLDPDLTVNGTFLHDNGTLRGDGNVVVTGATTWESGTWRNDVGSPSITVNGGLTIQTTSLKTLNGRDLVIPSGKTATWTNGEIRPTGDPLIHNDGTFDIQTDSDLNAIDGTFGTFQNDGTLQKTAGSAGTHIEMDFDNTSTGSVVVAASVGTLILGDVSASPDTSGTGSGSFSVDTGSSLAFEADHALQSGFQISGAGQVNFNSGTQTLANAGSTYDITGTTRRQGFSGKTTFNLTPDSVGVLEVNDSTLEFADTTAFAATSLEITGGAVLDLDPDLTVNGTFLHDNGTLRGDGNVVVTGATTWESGTWRNDVGSPSITVNGGLTIQTSSLKTLNGRDLIIPSGKTATWTDGEIRPDNDPLIDNQGTFDIQTEQNINDINDNFGTFKNAGTLQKTSGTANATVIEMDFDNTGSVVVNAGVLVLGDEAGQDTSGTSPGSFTAAAGTLLRFEGTHDLQAGSSVTGDGTVHFTSGSDVTIGGSWAVDGLTSITSGASADFDTATSVAFGDFSQVNGIVELTDASVSGDFTRNSGSFTHGAGGTLTFDAAGSQNLDLSTATTFVNLAVASGTTLVEVDPADNATVTGTVTNDGTIRKTQAISGTGSTNYGLTEIDLNTTTLGTLSELQVDRIDDNHPLSTPETFTGRYWTLTPTGGGYTVDLTLLHDGITMPLACRHEGMAVWDCDVDSSTATTVTRTGVTQLSDWAAGDAAPTYSLIIRLGMKTSPEGPIVEWETASHEGVIGFYVERWDEMTGTWLALHGDLLPAALDSPGGAVYRLLDPGADPAAMPRYRVLEVEAGGGDARAHGPYDAPDLGATGSMPHRFVAEPKRPSRELAERLETSRHERTTYDAARALGASVDEALRVAIDGQRLGAPIASRRPSSSLSGLLADGGAPGLGPDERSSLLSPDEGLPEGGLLNGSELGESEIRHEREEPGEREGHLGTSKVKERFKIVVGGDGIQLLSAAQLATLAGLPEPPIQNAIRKGRLSLSTAGTEVAWQPLAGGTGLVFWGEARESIFSTENTYWLEVTRGRRMGRVNGGSPTPGVPGVFDDTVHFEESQLAFTVQAEDPEGDFLFWDFLAASSPPYDARQFTLPVQGLSPSGAPATLTVELFGGTDRIPAIDHHAEVSLNGTVLGETTWGGIGTHTATFAVPPGLVVDTNTVTVTSTLQPGVPFSLIYVDSFDLTYERRLDAQGGQLVVSLPTSETVTVEGFTSPEIAVLDVTDPLRPSLVVNTTTSLGTTHEVTFVAEAGATYATADMAALAPPTRLTFEEPTNLTELRGADWVAIAPATLLPGADALALHRQSFGPSTLVVDLEAIYDEFNHGLADPLAIKAFLQAAWTNWSNPPRFAVLVGSGTYDYTDAMGFGGNLVPPALRSTPYGLFASDPYLGDVAGNDGVPEIAVGRIPALTAADLDAYVDKLALYEGAAGGGFTEMLLMADDPDEGGDFPADSDALAALAPAGTNLQKVYLPDHTLPNARSLVFGAFAAGIDVATFLGHGGLTVMTEEGLLTIDDVPALQVGSRLPVLASLTCTVGRFEIPGTEALGAALVAEPDAGTAAVWAPSGLSWHDDARPLSEGFVEALFDPSVFTLGDAIRAAQLEGQQGGVPRFMLEVYNLLGDPGFSLR